MGEMEDFRIYYNALSPEMIYSNYLSGVDQSRVRFTSDNTKSNIDLTFYATSRQAIRVNMFGGLNPQGGVSRMFDESSVFELTPTDSTCQYRESFTLTSASTFLGVFSAMNYTISLVAAPQTAPSFSSSACDPTSGVTNCFCSSSLAPMDYFQSTNSLTQAISIVSVNSSEYTVNYNYRSGFCMSVSSTDEFSRYPGNLHQVAKQSCFAASAKVLEESDKLTMNIRLFERYPSSNAWIESSTPISDINNYVIDYSVDDASVSILDQVSGSSDVVTVPYNSTMVARSSLSPLMVPIGVQYNMTAAEPMTAGALNWIFQVETIRNSPVNDKVTALWYVPVVGVVAKEVPNLYPVSTDADMIYMIIRDPPGGASSTTVHAGTTLDFTISSNHMHAVDGDFKFNIGARHGMQPELSICGGVGMMACAAIASPIVEYKANAGYLYHKNTEKVDSKSYKLSFTFAYDFSTSTDPYMAGHPSDVIVGGGVDMIVNEALIVKYGYSDANTKCLALNETNQWMPGRATTYVLPVMEIEKLVVEIADRKGREGNTPTVEQQLTKAVTTWQHVLAQYRNHSTTLYSSHMFTDIDRQWNRLVNQIASRPLSDGNNLQDIREIDEKLKDLKSDADYARKHNDDDGVVKEAQAKYDDFNAATPDYMKSMKKYFQACKVVAYANDDCNEFDRASWTHVGAILNNFCRMPSSADHDTTMENDLKFVRQLCKRGSVDGNNVPGGLTGADQQTLELFGFLSDPTKTVTFGANAPMTIEWTSSSDEGSTYEYSKTESHSTELEAGFEIGVVKPAKTIVEGNTGGGFAFSLTSKLSHDINEESTHGVSIRLDDNEQGDYFAVSIVEDPIFGTPVFITVGGESKCPGETGTSRRESEVKIVRIVHRCGATRNLTCDEFTLTSPDAVANFGVVILNQSPTKDTVTYDIALSASFDTYYDHSFAGKGSHLDGYCGTPGQRSGLIATFSQSQQLIDIPYNKLIEVPFTVKGSGLCNEYKDVEVYIMSDCEAPTKSSSVYQYGVIYDPTSSKGVAIDYDTVHGAAMSTAKFNVKWNTGSTAKTIANAEALPLEARTIMETHTIDVKINQLYFIVCVLIGAIVFMTIGLIVGAIYYGKYLISFNVLRDEFLKTRTIDL